MALILYFWLILYFDSYPNESTPLLAQIVKNLPSVQETWVWSLSWEDPLQKGMAAHSTILAWRIPWTEEPGGLQSVGSQRVRDDLVTRQQQRPLSHTIYKTNSKWLKDLNVKPEGMTLLVEHIGSMLSDINRSGTFLDLSLQARETKAKINKRD